MAVEVVFKHVRASFLEGLADAARPVQPLLDVGVGVPGQRADGALGGDGVEVGFVAVFPMVEVVFADGPAGQGHSVDEGFPSFRADGAESQVETVGELGVVEGGIRLEKGGSDLDGGGVVSGPVVVVYPVDSTREGSVVQGVVLRVPAHTDIWPYPLEMTQILQQVVRESVGVTTVAWRGMSAISVSFFPTRSAGCIGMT